MPRGVQEGDLPVLQGEHRLLGEDSDAPLPLQVLRIQEGVALLASLRERLGEGFVDFGGDPEALYEEAATASEEALSSYR